MTIMCLPCLAGASATDYTPSGTQSGEISAKYRHYCNEDNQQHDAQNWVVLGYWAVLIQCIAQKKLMIWMLFLKAVSNSNSVHFPLSNESNPSFPGLVVEVLQGSEDVWPFWKMFANLKMRNHEAVKMFLAFLNSICESECSIILYAHFKTTSDSDFTHLPFPNETILTFPRISCRDIGVYRIRGHEVVKVILAFSNSICESECSIILCALFKTTSDSDFTYFLLPKMRPSPPSPD